MNHLIAQLLLSITASQTLIDEGLLMEDMGFKDLLRQVMAESKNNPNEDAERLISYANANF